MQKDNENLTLRLVQRSWACQYLQRGSHLKELTMGIIIESETEGLYWPKAMRSMTQLHGVT